MHTPEPFGRYTLVESIGAGGMAEVFRATLQAQAGIEKTLVVKRILKALSSEEAFIEMFIDEARIAALLQHPNVVQVFDFGKVDEHWFMAMEWVDGLNLHRLLRHLETRQARMPVDVAVFIAHEAAKGLRYAHELTDAQGRALHVVHRDVCPQNLLIGWRGEVKVADFGIAKSAASSFTTRGFGLKGHTSYMSPEQTRGWELDGRSDLFSLGVVLWEALAGRRLFKTSDPVLTLEAIRGAEVPQLRGLREEVSPELEALVHACLARDPDARPQTARELRVALARGASASPDELRDRFAEWLAETCEGLIVRAQHRRSGQLVLPELGSFDPEGVTQVALTDGALAGGALAGGALAGGALAGGELEPAELERTVLFADPTAQGGGAPQEAAAASGGSAPSQPAPAPLRPSALVSDSAQTHPSPLQETEPRRRGALWAILPLAALLIGVAWWATPGDTPSAPRSTVEPSPAAVGQAASPEQRVGASANTGSGPAASPAGAALATAEHAQAASAPPSDTHKPSIYASGEPRAAAALPSDAPPSDAPSGLGALGGEAGSGEPRSGEPRSGDTRSGDTRSGDTRSGEAREGEAAGGEPRGSERRRGADTRSGADTRITDARGVEPRSPASVDDAPNPDTSNTGTPGVGAAPPGGDTSSGDTSSGDAPSPDTPSDDTPATVSVRLVTGWGQLQIDGVRVRGSTPFEDLSLAPGPHLFQVEVPSTGRVWSREVTLEPGQHLELVID